MVKTAYPSFNMAKQNAILLCDLTEISTGNEIVTLADAKFFARVGNTSEDAVFTGLIPAARQWIEAYLNKSITAKNIVCQIYQDGTFPQLLPYGDVTDNNVTAVSFRPFNLTPWTDITAQRNTYWEIDDLNKGAFLSQQPGFYRISYTTTPNLTCLQQLQTAIKQMIVFLYENRGDQQLYQVGDAREATRVVPDIIKHTLQGLKENTSWFG